jgi:hypothetical protein
MNAATSLMPAASAAPTAESAASFPELLAALGTLPGDPGTGIASERDEPKSKDEGPDQDGKRATLASSFLNISQVPVDPCRPLVPEMNFDGSAPVQAKAPQIPDQRAPVLDNRTAVAQLAFALVLQTPAAHDSKMSNPPGSDVSDKQASNKPAAELRSAAILTAKPGGDPAPVSSEPISGCNSGRRNSADPDYESGSPRILPPPSRIEAQATTFLVQSTQTGAPAQDAPPPPVEKPHPAPPAPPDQEQPGVQRPVQNLQIRLGEDSQDAVQVQISQQAGNIHVSVRSGDPALTSPLRQNLPELVENLERHGYHAEPISTHEPAAVNVLHSEVKSQADQNQSWYGSDHGSSRRQAGGETKGRKRRTGNADFNVPLSQIQETNA